jgi:flavin reductase (DIM6/NTAB) family NADH-FMN oxidoreductase RutF
VNAPVVAECPVALECKVRQKLQLGTHDVYIAEITAVQVSEEFLTPDGKFDLSGQNLLAYVCGQYYSLGSLIGSFGFSKK